MKIKTYSFRYAEEILKTPKFRHIYDEVISICKLCPIPYYEGKSKKQKELCVIQQMMNNYFLYMFKEECGWDEEANATPENTMDDLKSDFRKKFNISNNEEITIQIEVEFGNAASSYRDYFKFQLSYMNQMADVCVLILPSAEMSKKIDSGMGSFEKTCRELPSAVLSTTVPILVIGLFEDEKSMLNLKERNYFPTLNSAEYLDLLKCKSKKYQQRHMEIIKQYYMDNKEDQQR